MLKTPKILLVTSARWIAVARLAMSLKNVGFAIEAVCPSGHPISKTGTALRQHPFQGIFPQASLLRAIYASHPEMVIPCDDLTTGYLHALHHDLSGKGPAANWIVKLIEHSLGDPASYPIASARSKLMTVAGQEGIRIPKSATVQNEKELERWLAENGLPAVLKTDGSSGGMGVKIVRTSEEARRAFVSLHKPPLTARVAKRAILDRDFNLLPSFFLRLRPLVNVQSFIRGRDATMAVACSEGNILASICFDVLHVWESKGPASLIRRKESAEMLDAAGKIVRKLKLSGLYGFDFMVEEETKNPYLIEMNPRATQTCHLPLGTGHDLPVALWAMLSGEPVRETRSVTDKSMIALFPQEWQRDPASPFLPSAYHDVPWDEPELVRACLLNRPRQWSTFGKRPHRIPTGHDITDPAHLG